MSNGDTLRAFVLLKFATVPLYRTVGTKEISPRISGTEIPLIASGFGDGEVNILNGSTATEKVALGFEVVGGRTKILGMSLSDSHTTEIMDPKKPDETRDWAAFIKSKARFKADLTSFASLRNPCSAALQTDDYFRDGRNLTDSFRFTDSKGKNRKLVWYWCYEIAANTDVSTFGIALVHDKQGSTDHYSIVPSGHLSTGIAPAPVKWTWIRDDIEGRFAVPALASVLALHCFLMEARGEPKRIDGGDDDLFSLACSLYDCWVEMTGEEARECAEMLDTIEQAQNKVGSPGHVATSNT